MLTGAISNAPILSHDHLETGPGSRAEVQLDNGNFIRVAPDTDLGFVNLVFGSAQAQLGIGTVIIHILQDSQTQLEIDTPSVAFHPITAGDYRISVFDNGTTQVSVRSGQLEMSSPTGSQTIQQGQSLVVRGDAGNPEFQQANVQPADQFDQWSASRDAELMSSGSAQYVSPDVTGAQDLDRYGNWVPSQYGQVWAPQDVPSDWSPYSDGQWTYADYYGWTWVGYEPWGWAPYHYGRWFYNTGVGWCWWPGARHGFGVGFGFGWSPALVSFFGYGSGLGWVSLAPYERFHPWWGRGFHGGFDSFRGEHDLRAFRNAGIRGGAMTAGFNSFGGAGHRYSIANAGQIRSASLYRGGLPVTPTSASYRFSDRSVNANSRFSHAESRTFFSRPSSANTWRSSAGGSFSGSRYAAPENRGGSFNGSRYTTPSGGSTGWQRFGSPAPQRQLPQNFSSRPNSDDGWHSFGQPKAPRYNTAPSTNYGYRAPQSSPNYGYRQPSTPSYNYRAPSAPRYSAPHQQSAPRYSAPRQQSAPHYSAPHGGGGGGNRGGGGGGHRR
jgi:hypothetical protein